MWRRMGVGHYQTVEVFTRFGVFLRPDPATCAAVTTVTGQLRAQYGLVSAGAFPPHVTLAGSLPVTRHEAELVAVLDAVMGSTAAFPVRNRGVSRLGSVLVYDVHRLGDQPNQLLVDLAAAVDAAVRPLLTEPPAGQLPADVHDPERWRGHVSLATHELITRPELLAEVEAYVHGLGVAVPASFTADTVGLYRFHHRNWTGAWWEDMSWEYVRGWTLPAAAG